MTYRMSKYMPERMSDRIPELTCHIYFQMVCQKHVRIVFQGGDHSMKVFVFLGGAISGGTH